MEEGADESRDGVVAREIKRLRLLVQQGLGLDEQRELEVGVREGRLDVVRYLVEECSADVNSQEKDGGTALMCAARYGHVDVVRYLVEECSADVNSQEKDGGTALMCAARYGHVDIVRFLANECSADVNSQDKDGGTALMCAARYGHVDVVRYLVEECSADVNSQEKDGGTALMCAARYGHVDVVRFLANEGGADVNIRNDSGWTALTVAASGGSMDLFQILVSEGGADVNMQDNDGDSALMGAAQAGHTDAVRFLVNEGRADVNMRNDKGHTAIRIASDRGHNDVVRLLTPFAQPNHRSTTPAGHKLLASDASHRIAIPPSEVELGDFYEQSNMGGDFRVKWLGADAVVKLFISDASSSTFEQEVRSWQELRHPNVLKLYGVCQAAPDVNFFVCEYASRGSLAEYTATASSSSSSDLKPLTWKFLYEAALGLEYLHERGIMHGDLRCSNILIGNDGMAKLSNFGSTEVANHPRSVIRSMRWQAPEVLEGSPASRASDVYSLGMCILEAGTGARPWSTESEAATRHRKFKWNADAHANVPYDRYDRNNPGGVYFVHGDDPHFVRRSRELVWRMCCKDPHERSSLTSIISELEQLSVTVPQPEAESASCFEGFKGEGAEEQWKKLHKCMDNGDNAQHGKLFTKLQHICDRLQESEHSYALLDRFYSLVADLYQTVKMTSEEAWAMQLSCTRATSTSMISFTRRVDALLKALGESVPEETEQPSWQQQRREQGAAFVLGIADTVLLLQSLKSVEEQAALLKSLKSEMESVEDKYTDEQLQTMKETYEAIESKLATEGVENAATLTPKWFIPWYELLLDEGGALGEGGFGSVRRAKWLDSDVVVKEVLLPGSDRYSFCDSFGSDDSLDAAVDQMSTDPQIVAKRAETQEMFRREADIWFGFSHPHVVRLFGACHIGRPFFVCEYATHGTLVSYLRKHPDELWAKLHEAALGVQYLHAREVVHGDLKGNNVVVGSDLKAKVTDFGLSSAVNSEATAPTGAWHWVAPECLVDKKDGSTGVKSTLEADVYSLGMCIVEALRVVEAVQDGKPSYGCLPWGMLDPFVVKYHVTRGKMPSRPSICADDQWNLVTRMCVLDPKKRIKISTVVDELERFAKTSTGSNTDDEVDHETDDMTVLKHPVNQESVVWMMAAARKLLSQLRGKTNQQDASPVLLYDSLWDRIEHVRKQIEEDNAEAACRSAFHSFVVEAGSSTASLEASSGDLISLARVVMGCYGLSHRLDKLCDANFLKNPRELEFPSQGPKVSAVPEWFISSDDVELDTNEAFDTGSYGAVTRGTWGKGAKVVIKSLLMDDDQAKESFFKEVEVWKRLNNPHVVKLFGACHVSTPAFFVCEDAIHGNFANHFMEDKSDMWKLFYEAALGLDYIHSQKVVHGDLKCNNIVIGADDKAKICDFGFSYIRSQSVGLSKKATTDTVRWKAPECLLPSSEENPGAVNPRFASDVYSFGMCIIEAFTDAPPYALDDDDTIMEKKFNGEQYPRPEGIADDEWELVKRLTDPDWKQRISLSTAISELQVFAGREKERKNPKEASIQKSQRDQVGAPTMGLGYSVDIPSLVTLVRSGKDVEKEKAAGALWGRSGNAANQEKIASAGGIPPLVELAKSGTDAQKSNAAGALWNLATHRSNQGRIASVGGIPPLVELVRSGNAGQKVNAAGALWNIAMNQAALDMIASAGGIPPLVELMSSGNDAQKVNAVGALWNLALEKSELRDLIIAQSGAVDKLVNLVFEGTQRQRELAAGVLGFLASDLPSDVRTNIATQGGIEALLLWITRHEKTEWIHEGLTALQGLCSDDNDTIRAMVKKFDGHVALSMIRESGNERNKVLAGQLLEWLNGNFTDLSKMCQRMGEAEPLCSRLLERVKALHDRRVDSICAVRARLRAVLVMNGDKPMIARILCARSLSETLADLHREIDLFEPDESREMWVSQWELDKSAMMQKLFESDISTLINSLGDAAAQEEALAMLVHEVKQNKSAYTKQQRAFLNDLLNRLAGLSSVGTSVDATWFILRNDVQVEDVAFRRGSFGKIYRGKYMNTNVAIKSIDIKSESDRVDFLREVNVWHEASRHPNIVPFFGACPVGNPCFLVSKCIAGGTLRDYLYRHKNESRHHAWHALLDVTHGLQHLHSKGIVHSNLKGNKILMEGDTAMLTGFSMSLFISGSQRQVGNLGALRWRAPEFIATKKASFEADVYSLGMCVIEAVTGKPPWGIMIPDAVVVFHLKRGEFLKKPESMSDDGWALVCAMCDFDPAKRITLVEVENRIREFAEMEAMEMRRAFPSRPDFSMHGLPGSPPSQKILRNLMSRIQRMPENETLFRHLLERIQYLHEPVAPLAMDDPLKLKYIEVVGHLVNLTRRQPLLLRLARCDNMVTCIRELLLKLSDIGQCFELVDEPAMTEWGQKWDADQGEQFLTISQLITRISERMLVAEFQGERKAEEALLVLQSSMNRKGQLPGMSALKQSTIDRVKRYLRLDSLPVYSSFIPSMDIVYENEPFRFGGYGDMRRGIWLCNGERRDVAIQLFSGESGDSRASREFISRLEWLSTMPENDHVLKVYGGSHLGAPPFYVYEKAPFGTLIEFLSDKRNGPMFWGLFEQAAEGLKFLHKNEIAHGNLTCSNIVIGENRTVKLLDVGGSTLLREHPRLENHWRPVEQLRDQADEERAEFEGDVYSLGMCMIEAITLEPPFGYFGDDSAVKELILRGKGHPRPEGVSDEVWTLIIAICNPDYNRRPSIYEVIERIRELARLEKLMPISIVPDKAKATAKTRAETPRVCACCGKNASGTTDRYCRWCGRIMQLNAVPENLERYFDSFLRKRGKMISRHGLPAYLKSCQASDAWRKLHQVAVAVQDLHREGITHGDLKPANLFIGRDGKVHLASEHNNLAAEFAKHQLPPPLNQAFRWQSPELLNGCQATLMSDVYALGMCAIYIVSGNPPWGDGLSEDEVKLQVSNGHAVPPRCQGVFTANEWSLIMEMCDRCPENRLGLDDVVRRLADIVVPERTQGPEWQLNDSDVVFQDDALFSKTQYVSRHLGRWKDAVVAVETVTDQFKRENQSFTNVADLWFSLKHPTILQLFGACCDDYQDPAFVCEYAERGDLRSYFCNFTPTRSRIWQILLDVALGIQYLHAIGVVHGDVGLHNILVKGSGRGKLGGFSLSSQVNHLCQDTSETEHKTESEATSGTKGAGFASDVYWFGCCIVDAFCGSQSVRSNTIEARTNEPRDMQRPEVLNEEEWALMMDMCCTDPAGRIEMPEVVKRLARLSAVNAAIDSELSETKMRLSVNQRRTLQAMVLEEVLEYEKEEEEEGERYEYDDDLDNYNDPLAGMRRKDIMQQSTLSSLAVYAARTIITPNLRLDLENYRPRPSVMVTPEVPMLHFVSPRQRIPQWGLSHASILEARQVEVLGNGAFASVSSGIWLGASVAIKKMSEVDLDHDQTLRQEANLWFTLRHPHIASLFGGCCGGYQLFVCDLVDGGSLHKYCCNQIDKSKEKVWGLLHDAAVGLQGLHSFGIVHADLKCDNILITKDGRAQLIDFGLSCLSTCDGGETEGAPRWKAPECLNGAGPTFASDVYSFGMCILQAMTGAIPWEGLQDIVVVRYVKNRCLPKQPKDISNLEWELVRRMCCFEPEDRLQVDEVVKVIGFFAQRDPYVNDQSIREALSERGDVIVCQYRPRSSSC